MRSNATVGRHQDQKTARNTIARAATQQIVEQLEGRRLLAADPYDFRNTPLFTPTTSDIANVKNGPLAKGGEALVDIYRAYSSYVNKGFNRYAFSQRTSYSQLFNIRGRDLLVTIRTRGSVDALVSDLKGFGSTIISKSKSSRIVEAFVPINQLENLTVRPEIMHARPQVRPTMNSVGAVGNDAERSQKTQFVIPAFGVDGTGQTVGVISDSFTTAPEYNPNIPGSVTHTSFDDGDLSNVDVLQDDLPGGSGEDEGRAMTELIHDLAPGADLKFNAVGGSQNTFAAAIRSLREAGSTVIVDDIGFGNEPFFGEGVIDRAINDVVEDGASYFTAAGNNGFAGYSKAVNFVQEPDSATGELAADFDSGSGVDQSLDIHIDKAGILYFQWDNAYDGNVANVTADVDVYLYRDGTLITSSTDDNFATGVPIEAVAVQDAGDYEMVVRLHSLKKGAQAPTMVKFVANGNNPDMFDSRTGVGEPGINGSTFGHTGATGAISVAAVDNAASNAFGTARNLVSQDFSSAGEVTRIFDPNGNRLAEPETIQAPLLSGIQGTNTTVFPIFQPFFGTSAAAPNVAAIAAMLRQLSPTATPDMIKDALVASAKNNPLNGSKAGDYDNQAGYGLVDAVQAASIFSPDIPVSTINASPTNNNGSIGSLSITFSEPVTGVDITDFSLTRDGTNVNRFTGSEGLDASADGMTYTITNLKSATGTLGVYTLTLRNNRTDILDVDNNVAAGNVVSFDVSLKKVSGLLADALDDGKIRLRWNAGNGGDGYRIQRATDAAFSEDIRNIDVEDGSTSYVDTDVVPGQQYYYRVRASKGGRLGDIAKVSIVSSSAGEIFVDDNQATLAGGWQKYDDTGAFLQSKSRASETDLLDEDPNTATFTSSDIATGNYFIYTRYTSTKTSASNASYQIIQGGKVIATVKINQKQRGGGWVLLGKFASTGKGALTVRLTSAGADGAVTADAVRFLPADQATIDAYKKQKAQA